MNKIVIVLAAITLFSCSKSKEDEVNYQFNLYAGLQFSVINSQNEDLLDTSKVDHIDVSKIKLFYQVDGEIKEVFDPNMENPRNIMFFKHENEYRIGVSLNYAETSDKPLTLIKWNENDIDTIEVTYNRTLHSIVQNKIWLNGNLIWELGDNTVDPYFILTK